jgi:N-acyl homoserine lactone hydrolase
MKTLLKLLFLLLLAGLAVLANSFRAVTLPVDPTPGPTLPQARPTQGVSLHAVKAGIMDSTAAFAFRGGSFSDRREFGMGGILVRHPLGNVLFDTGFGRDVDAHLQTIPMLMRATSTYRKEATVAEQLSAAGILPSELHGIVLTHAHWDHVSGLPDLPGVPVLVNQEELDFIRQGGDATVLARSFPNTPYKVYGFDGGPYVGFDHSLDLFGDGSVVLVKAGGHTPGSIIAFISTSDARRYALVGDLVWQSEGVNLPAERPWLARRLVDKDPARVRDLLVQLHRLQQANRDLLIVPAHDRRVWDTLPPLAAKP